MAIKKKILHIENDPNILELVEAILKYDRRGIFEFRGAESGREGLAMMRQERPDLILLDLMMPFMSGWEVYHQIKADENLKDIPIVVVTARDNPIDRAMGLDVAKVDAYITKPFNPNDLVECIYHLLGIGPA